MEDLIRRIERLKRSVLTAEIRVLEPPLRPPPRQQPLSSEQQGELAAHYQAGTSILRLAEDYGIHHVTVTAILERHGVARRYRILDDRAVALARQLYESGHSLVDVGSRFGVCANTVRRSLIAAGVSVRPVGTNQWG